MRVRAAKGYGRLPILATDRDCPSPQHVHSSRPYRGSLRYPAIVISDAQRVRGALYHAGSALDAIGRADDADHPSDGNHLEHVSWTDLDAL